MAPLVVFDASHYTLSPDGYVVPTSKIPEFLPRSLLANMICRVVIGIWALLACIVPLRLLYRNGEFAAVVCIVSVMILIIIFVVNAFIWHNQDTSHWWDGLGYCDFNIYIVTACQVSVVAAVFAVMRNLSQNINVLRVGPLTHKERKRKNIIQAVIIFLPALVQLGWIYPLSPERYNIMPLNGCTFRLDPSWPVLFFLLPEVAYPVGAGIYAILIYTRFRQIRKSNDAISVSSNPLVRTRNNRARRRLYFMSLSIVIPYLPCALYVVVMNLISAVPLQKYNFDRIHRGETWNVIIFIAGEWVSLFTQNYTWVYPLFALPIFCFFGLSKDAINEYRVALVKCGFAKIWPVLLEEYSPYRTQQPSWVASIIRSRVSRDPPGQEMTQNAVSSTPASLDSSMRQEKMHNMNLGALSGSSSNSLTALPDSHAPAADNRTVPGTCAAARPTAAAYSEAHSANTPWGPDLEQGVHTTCCADEFGVESTERAQRRRSQGQIVLEGVSVQTDIARSSEPATKK